jgi:beta-lactam-binding protein with PASTA domain/tRNA A-37 threonylcarbamoyl transferase component Bud32
MEPIQAPRVFSDRYELTHLIARGGMAQVYRARDRLLDRPVALKVLFPELSVDRAFVERFRREAQAAAKLSHPNIVPVFDWGEDSGTYFIVMEYVDGRPLSAELRADGPLAPHRVVDVGAHVAAALAYAHRHGVVHRDVKPGNVLITEDGQVKVTDFGIARAVNTEESLTQTGAVMGTATYFSPEQAEGVGVDSRSDIYSLGVVLFEMATGRPPFLGETPVAVASKHVRDVPPMPRELNPSVPVELEAVIMKAMAKTPADRYQTADELRADLLRFAEGRPVVAGTLAPTRSQPAVATTQAIGALGRTATLPITEGPAGSPPAEDPRRRKTRRLLIVLVVLLVVLALIAFFLARSLGYLGGGSFALPNVVGETQAVAVSTLEAKGLHVATPTQVTSSRPKGVVVATRPSPGTSVTKGQTVLLRVSSGPPSKVTVPYLEGQNFTNAAASLQGLGLIPREVFKASSQPNGQVLSQSPAAGSKVRAGATVVLTVSSQNTVTVPNVVGQAQTQAGAAINGANLTVGSTTSTCSNQYTAGQVAAQSPAADTQAAPKTAVNITVSTGPCQAAVPNVVGDSPGAATNALNGLGFTNVSPSQTTSCSTADNGTVVAQNPLAGATAPTSATVSITVCNNPPPTTSTSSTTTTTTTSTVPGSGSGSPPAPGGGPPSG